MNQPRIFYECELGALAEYQVRRSLACPDGQDAEFEAGYSKLVALHAAMSLPESALPVLMFLSKAHSGPVFRNFAKRLAGRVESQTGSDSSRAEKVLARMEKALADLEEMAL
jgi:hypothetical protein